MWSTSWQSHAPIQRSTRSAPRALLISLIFLLSSLTGFISPPIAAAQSPQFRYERRLTRETLPQYRISATVSADSATPSGSYSQQSPPDTYPVVRSIPRIDRAGSLSIRAPRPR